MLTRIRKAMEDKEQGFTLIELLVVIIIIGILAAIAIPTFLRQREKGWDAASKAELKNIATAEESYFTTNGVYLPATSNTDTAITTSLKAEGYNLSEPFSGTGTVAVKSVSPFTAYCIQVSHKSQSAVVWSLSSGSGAPVKAACP